jgi:hypothetical protein
MQGYHCIVAMALAVQAVEDAEDTEVESTLITVQATRAVHGVVTLTQVYMGWSQVHTFTAERYSPHQIMRRYSKKEQAPAPRGTSIRFYRLYCSL